MLILLGCGHSDPAKSEGERLYQAPHDDGNTFACATCHALEEPAADMLLRPGHPIGDAAARPSWKNGQLSELIDAVNTCRVEWMNAPAFEADDRRWLALEEFLAAQAPASAPALNFEIQTPPSDLSGGDPERGREVFHGSCVACHGEDAAGTERAPPLVGDLLEPEYIARRIRTGGSEESPVYQGLTGGRMPFWAADRLSDGELVDIVAFVDENDPEGSGGDGPGGDLRDCEASHPRVGEIAELETKFHGVSGTAEIVDDCTVEITDFSYDGQGIVVELYGGPGGDYDAGFSMSDDLRRDGGYSGETIYAQLPEGRALDELDGISVWCVSVGQSFGDGLFAAP